MSAGLPGLGLGGLFFIFSALLAPFRELWRTLRGRSGLAAWRAVGRQFAQAALMVAAIDLTLRFSYLALSELGIGNPPPADTGTVLPLTLIGITSGLLLTVVTVAKLAELAGRIRVSGVPRVPETLPSPTPVRAMALGGAAAIAWLALLAVGASDLSPLGRPRSSPTVEPDAAVAEKPPSRSAVTDRRQVVALTSGRVGASPSRGGGWMPTASAGDGTESPGGPVGEPSVQSAPAAVVRPHSSPVPAAAGSPVTSKAPKPPRETAAAPDPAAPPSASGEQEHGPPTSAPAAHPTGPPADPGPPAATGPPVEAGPPADAGAPEGPPASEHRNAAPSG